MARSRFRFGDIVQNVSGDTAMTLGVCTPYEESGEPAEVIVLLAVSGRPGGYQSWYLASEPVRWISQVAFDATFSGDNGWRPIRA